ncbi:hypothetical protein [Mycolicibacterium sp.]|uniref:hypothetical protein n=1 Tax=Mycolicibacterium sp. TaxID=2320850 RepID=UPI0037C6B968
MSDDKHVLAAIYAADRADGSAILGASMNLIAVIAAYGGIVLAALGGADFFESDRGAWIQAVVAAPLWGLICYHYVLLTLVLARTNSIRILERKLLGPIAVLKDKEKNQIGSDAGDWISNVKTQPLSLKPGSLAAYGSISLAAISINVASVALLYNDYRGQFYLGAAVHGILFVCFLSVLLTYLIGGGALLSKMEERRGAYPVIESTGI